MGILGSKEKTNSPPPEESPKELRRKHIEMLGREFTIVKDGLDPKEVVEFLEASAGSSEAAFKHLEQFSAFQSVARTMDKSIQEARQLAEQAKAKAKAEADRTKTKAIVEAQQQSTMILDETMRNCIASVEGIHSVILDAIGKTETIQNAAFKKTREMVATNMAEIQQNIQAIVEGRHRKKEPDTESTVDVPEMPVESVRIVKPTEPEYTITLDKVDDEKIEETEEEPVFDLSNLQESLMSLEMSLSNLNESKHTLEPTLETQVNVLERVEEDDEEEDLDEEDEAIDEWEDEQEEQPVDTESHDNSSDDTERQYSGEVTVQIVGGAEEAWMQKLRQQMLDLPGVRIRAESGVDEKTTMVSLSLGEPVSLFPLLLALPRVNRVVPGRLNGKKEGKLRLWSKSHKNSAKNTITVELYSNGQTQSTKAESEDDPMAAS